MRVVNLGDTFGSLKVIRFFDGYRKSGTKKSMCECECECGERLNVEKYNLSSGNTKRCQLCASKIRGDKKSTHKASMAYKDRNPEMHNCYTRWQSMKRRCYKEYDSHYPRYGGRGIKVCDRWLNSFESFLDDMGLPPTKKHQIDRIDNDGNYESSNCRWVSQAKNSRNKSNNRIISAFGRSQTLVEWAEETGIKRETIAMRIRRGWSEEKALSKK
ncbi:MAG: hypothetical protein VYC55_07810 [Pseudomonadota bacterium]|nr:hypothetical protein [Pseudomonadota bacterium]